MLGVDVHALTARQVLSRIATAMGSGDRLLIGNHNLHSTYLVRTSPAMRRFYERADLVYVDGMPLVLASRTLRRQHRATLLDWIDPLLDLVAARRSTAFLLGSTEPVVAAAARAFADGHPGAHVVAHHGFFDVTGAENDAVVAAVNHERPDLLLVGMGMPRQEIWLAENFDRLDVRIAIAVGGLFDYHAGVTATPPRWMGPLGIEWLGRLAADPRRLGHRYLIEPLLLSRDLLLERMR